MDDLGIDRSGSASNGVCAAGTRRPQGGDEKVASSTRKRLPIDSWDQAARFMALSFDCSARPAGRESVWRTADTAT